MKKNNKGSALVMVLIILTIVGILAAVALWVSLVNYQMKLTDIKVKNNFYSAESVLDQICVGLQKDVSEAYEAAYKKVSLYYTEMSDIERKNEFESLYKNELKKRLKATDDATNMSYRMDILKGYVYQNLQDNTKLPYAQIQVVDRAECKALNGVDGRMITYNNHIVLKGIEVTFTDEDGYTSIIETDISLGVPQMQFVTAENMPNTMTYSIVGTTGVTIEGNTSILGSLYAGNNGNIAQDVSLDIRGAVNFEKSKYVVSYGKTKVNIAQELKISRDDTQFWTHNIEVDGSKAKLWGNTLVADDMTLKGNNPEVILGSTENANSFTGKYVGFGDSKKNATDSSAIILNGVNSTLDMSHLRQLKLGGYAFINTEKINSGISTKNSDITTGESIAIKSGQIAYLVPPECIGVDKDGKSEFGRNPITYEEKEIIDKRVEADKDAGYKEVSATVFARQMGASLDNYLKENQDISSVISKVYDPVEKLVYYYINLEPEQAGRYFRNYYATGVKDKLELYTDFYTKEIQLKEKNSLVRTAGNSILYNDEDGININNAQAAGLADELIKYKSQYEAFQYILYPNSDRITNEIRARGNVFNNLISDEGFEKLLDGAGKKEIVYNHPATEDKNMKAILVKGDYEYKATDDPKGQVALIISTGNVTVSSNFKGTIIAKGKVFIGMTAAQIASRTSDEAKRLLSTEDAAGVPLYKAFVDGENYLSGTVDYEDGVVKQDKVPYSDIITYQNWKMK